jgi:hypothetical protein
LHAVGLPNDPEAVGDAVFVFYGGDGRDSFGVGEDGVDAALGIAVEHEELAGVRARVAQELEAVGFGAGERVFVTEDDASGIFLEFAGADEAAADAALVGAGNRVFLGVGVEAVGVILLDDGGVDPGLQRGFRAGVHVVLGIVGGKHAALFYSD